MSPNEHERDRDTYWRDDAACIETDPQLWFPNCGDRALVAKAICAECPVRDDCLAHALRTGQRYGIWGGLTALERQGMRTGRGTR